MILISLRDKRSLVTGAAAGIGEAVSKRLAEAGSDIVLVGIDEDELKRVAGEIRSARGVDVEHYRVNLSRRSEIERLWRELAGPSLMCWLTTLGYTPSRTF